MHKFRNFIKKRCYPAWPKSADMCTWAEVHKEARKKKLCYWLSNTIPTWLSVKGMQIHDIKLWFQYRFQTRHKYHLIDTKLGYGYHEIENRLLHGAFSLLQNYVEVELACINDVFNKEAPKRGRGAGLQQLAWQISLKDDDESSTWQSENAQKIKDLYLWWMDTRPARMDPWDDEDWEKSKPKREKGESVMELFAKRTPEQKEAASRHFAKRETINEAYQAEDEKMLIRLIRIRKSLWT